MSVTGAPASHDPSASRGFEVSIVIPTRNGGRKLGAVLEAIAAQESDWSLEVVAVDSGSTDGSLELLGKFGVRVHRIPPCEFSHSRTRNLGASLARARRFLLFLNQDAVPDGPQWLERLLQPLLAAPDVKAACAIEIDERRQKPYDVVGIGSCVFRSSLVDAAYVMGPELLELAQRLPRRPARDLFVFTTVCAVFDRAYFDSHPFDPLVEYGEDLHWALAAIRDGFKVACVAGARVRHAHEVSTAEYLRRLDRDVALGEELFGPGYRSRWYGAARAFGLIRLDWWMRRALAWGGRRLQGS